MTARRAGSLVPLALLLATASLSGRDPTHLDPALAFARPSAAHPLGCGEAGADLLAVLASGVLRACLLAAVVGVGGLVLGAPLGMLAALRRGTFERFVERLCDLVQSFPSFLLALAVLSAVRVPGRVHVAAVLSITAWAPFARLAISQTRVLRSALFLDAARALGVRGPTLVVRHIAPHVADVMAVQLGSSAAAVVVSEAALAFVGLGPRDGVSLGAVLDQGVASMLFAPHVLTSAALAIIAASAGLLLAGRALSRAS